METPTPVVVVTRHPDYDNEYQSFGVDPRQRTIDIDFGRSDLSSSDELLSWANSHLDEADELDNAEAREYIRKVIAEEVTEQSDTLDAEDQGVRDEGKALFARLELDWSEYIEERSA